ncbi:hypothetical protein METBIDRAFT_29683 [Metschnikowia bicuspidata var. bicuspidata NRRL YB-4993]|uniref:Pre-mRNA-splicing factor 18 n=1 Tax=Metschnikowia bicuspidata var. bicuspidata NRRL YB-4993 TaxID=869754 RepID=A0A1A0HH29_9ASCO|nr:hypothetical protein METBIDRAFT_29683 [Metschnikowia bicuspidata var. bicuspidata NRRL YB-4993]OBA23153.1 hypothetical protein METBIDRAFT_29683 [Metschnikowia bicuspidata var. bicuspidata NRRL YB-4993]
MDISQLLAQQLQQKQRQRQRAKQQGTPKETCPGRGDKPQGTPQAQQNEQGPEAGQPDPPVSTETDEARLLDSIDADKLAESLRRLDENGQGGLKAEQLRRLQIHVRHEKKDLRYKAYLDRETRVPAHIALADIAAQNSATLCLQIRRFFKEILQTWTLATDVRSADPVLLETKRDIVKLMYKLRSGSLPQETVVSLSTIVYYIQTENIVKANEAYLKLSIGNVAWPIGVRDVGIHARAADAKIAGDDKKQLSNIMKSEATRRWLIAVKRIVNYCAQLHDGRA